MKFNTNNWELRSQVNCQPAVIIMLDQISPRAHFRLSPEPIFSLNILSSEGVEADDGAVRTDDAGGVDDKTRLCSQCEL